MRKNSIVYVTKSNVFAIFGETCWCFYSSTFFGIFATYVKFDEIIFTDHTHHFFPKFRIQWIEIELCSINWFR